MKKQLLAGLAIGSFLIGLNGIAQATPINWALTGTATQSSTALDANNAIDDFIGGSTATASRTGVQAQAWWEVNLIEERSIDSIDIWNTTDYTAWRLNNFNVSIYDTNHVEIWTGHYDFSPSPTLEIDFGAAGYLGQYVRVQLAGTNYFALDEVQVWGDDTTLVAEEDTVIVGDDNPQEGGTAPVPEPATMLLFGAGLAGLAGRRLKKQQK